MKTIVLTQSEVDTLYDYLFCNPCEGSCICGYKRIGCNDTKADGTYRCELQRNTESILKKLGYYDECVPMIEGV